MLRNIQTICMRCGRLVHRCAGVCPLCGSNLSREIFTEIEELVEIPESEPLAA